MNMEIDFLSKENFDIEIVNYDKGWMNVDGDRIPILQQTSFDRIEKTENSWSTEIENIHEEPTKDGWIDVYERQKVLQVFDKIFTSLEREGKRLHVLELGASSGYMIGELSQRFTVHKYIATDLFVDGLIKSYKRAPDIMHIQCDCTDIPITDNSIHILYALNMLEHVADDKKAIAESYRVLARGGIASM